MKKVRKPLCLILCLLACISMLVSCGSTSNNTSASPSTAPSASASANASPSANAASSPSTSASPSAKPAKYADNMNVIIDNNKISAINPLAAGGLSSSTGWVYKMVYDTLVSGDGKGGYVPNLAKSWDTTDWKTVTFKLRDDVSFTNGEKLKASDVVFTVQSAQAVPGCTSNSTWTQVDAVKALDDTTVQFTLKMVYPQFLYDISQQWGCIINEKAVKADPDKGAWVGTGAWIITDFATNDFVKMKANDKYWGDKKPVSKTMTLKFIPEEATRLMMLQNGECDICFSVNPEDLPIVEKDTAHYTTFPFTGIQNMDLGFNMNDPICGDLNFRMAVASAINRQDIATVARGAYAIPETTGTFWGYGLPFRADDIPIIPNNLDAAKKYLAASSYKGQTIEIVAAIADCVRGAQLIQQELAQIGIKITVKQTDPGSINSYATYKDNKCQMYCFVAAMNLNPYSSYGIYYPGAIQNRSSYNNPEIAKLFDQVVTVSDKAKQQEIYTNIQKLAAKDVPFLSLYFNKQVVVAVKGVDGLVLSNDSGHDLRFMYKVVG